MSDNIAGFTLTQAEHDAIVSYAGKNDADWPADVPQELSTLQFAVNYLRAKGLPVAGAGNLDKAIQKFREAERAKTDFQRVCHPNLRRADGTVAPAKLAKLANSAFADFGGVTVENLKNAFKLLRSRGELELETALPPPEQVEQGYPKPTQSYGNAESLIMKPSDSAQLTKAEGFALKKVLQAREAASTLPSNIVPEKSMKELIHELADVHQKAKAANVLWPETMKDVSHWHATLKETSALLWVAEQFVHPPGPTYTLREDSRKEILAIVAEEYQGVRFEDLAPWTRTARRIQESFEKESSRSIR